MGKTVDKKVKLYIKELLENSGAKEMDIAKLAILADSFYENNKEALDSVKVPFLIRKTLMSNFILFLVQFETVCVKAYKPSGSGSTADDIIHLYSSIGRSKFTSKQKLLITKV